MLALFMLAQYAILEIIDFMIVPSPGHGTFAVMMEHIESTSWTDDIAVTAFKAVVVALRGGSKHYYSNRNIDSDEKDCSNLGDKIENPSEESLYHYEI